MNQAGDNNDKKLQQIMLDTIKQYLRTSAFTDRKISDRPLESLSLVNRKYVTANGTFATRPGGAVTGQFYFATDLATNGLSSWYNGTNWVSATGSVLGAGV